MNVKEAEAVIKGIVDKYGIEVFTSRWDDTLTSAQLYLPGGAAAYLDIGYVDQKSLELATRRALDKIARYVIRERSQA